MCGSVGSSKAVETYHHSYIPCLPSGVKGPSDSIIIISFVIAFQSLTTLATVRKAIVLTKTAEDCVKHEPGYNAFPLCGFVLSPGLNLLGALLMVKQMLARTKVGKIKLRREP